MPDNGEKRFQKILEGIQYIARDNELLRQDLKEYSRLAAEDRKQAIEDRRQAAEDRKQAIEDRRQAAEDRRQAAEHRREMRELIGGIRQALVVIGKRGGEFVEIQKKQGRQLDSLIEIARTHGEILAEIRKILRNGKRGEA
jgi:hypothetical protein